MVFLDAAAVLVIALGAILGARRGLWKCLAGGTAVGLGAASGLGLSGPIAAALRDLGVGSPGDAIIGFFIPFALVSVYARFLAGLWLSRRLERTPERNRLLGAMAGAVWAAFAAGFIARTCVKWDGAASSSSTGPVPAGRPGGRDADGPCRTGAAFVSPSGSAGLETGPVEGNEAGPFTTWLARYPGRLGEYVVGRAFGRGTTDGGRCLAGALMRALDGSRAQSRAARGDAEARSSLGGGRNGRKRRVVPLRVESSPRVREVTADDSR